MNLLDILARELTEWAGDVGAITQDKLTGELFDYYHCPLRGGNEREVSSIADDAGEAHDGASGAAVTRAEWQAAVDALNAPKVVEWDEVGLPPVGLDVEIKRGNCTWLDGDEWQIGKTATVMASFLNSRDIEMASVQFPGGHCECILARCLSPIRTAEQVAAEEREKARTEVLNAMTKVKNEYEPEALWKFRLKVVGEMLDMGYRKQVAK